MINHKGESDSEKIVFNLDALNENDQISEICGFIIYDDVLYVKDTGISCYSYNMNSGELFKFNDDISSGVFLDNKFYFTEHAQRTFSIFSQDIESRERELLRGKGETFYHELEVEDKMYDKLITVDNKLYYSTRFPAELYLLESNGDDYKIDGFSNTDIAINFLVISNDANYIYYTHKETSVLYRYNSKTREVTESMISDDFKECKFYRVFKNVVYYVTDNSNIKTHSILQWD